MITENEPISEQERSDLPDNFYVTMQRGWKIPETIMKLILNLDIKPNPESSFTQEEDKSDKDLSEPMKEKIKQKYIEKLLKELTDKCNQHRADFEKTKNEERDQKRLPAISREIAKIGLLVQGQIFDAIAFNAKSMSTSLEPLQIKVRNKETTMDWRKLYRLDKSTEKECKEGSEITNPRLV